MGDSLFSHVQGGPVEARQIIAVAFRIFNVTGGTAGQPSHLLGREGFNRFRWRPHDHGLRLPAGIQCSGFFDPPRDRLDVGSRNVQS